MFSSLVSRKFDTFYVPFNTFKSGIWSCKQTIWGITGHLKWSSGHEDEELTFCILSYGGFSLKFYVFIYENTPEYTAPVAEGSQRYWQIGIYLIMYCLIYCHLPVQN